MYSDGYTNKKRRRKQHQKKHIHGHNGDPNHDTVGITVRWMTQYLPPQSLCIDFADNHNRLPMPHS